VGNRSNDDALVVDEEGTADLGVAGMGSLLAGGDEREEDDGAVAHMVRCDDADGYPLVVGQDNVEHWS